MRAADPAAAVRAFVAAGRPPADPAAVDRVALREDLRRDRRGGRPRGRRRRGRRDRPQPGARHAPRVSTSTRPRTWPRLVRSIAPAGGAADRRRHRRRDADDLAPIVAAVDPDAVQLQRRRADRRRSPPRGRPAWKVLHLPAECGRATVDAAAALAAARSSRARAAAYLRRRRRADPARHGRWPASRAGPAPSERDARGGVAREVPVTLAGGLDAGQRRPARSARSRPSASTSRRASRRPRAPASARARTRSASRCSSSGPGPRASTGRTSPSRPTPVHAGPARGRRARPLGRGPRLRRSLRARDARWRRSTSSSAPTPSSATTRASGPSSASCWRTYAGRPTPIYRADRLAAETLASRSRRRALARPGADRTGPTASASTSSARTSPTPAPTRSTTRSARRC